MTDKEKVEILKKMSDEHIAELILNCPIYEGDLRTPEEVLDHCEHNREFLENFFWAAEENEDYEWPNSIFINEKYAAQRAYDAANTTRYSIKLNNHTDGIIIQWLNGTSNKQGAIKRALRYQAEVQIEKKHIGERTFNEVFAFGFEEVRAVPIPPSKREQFLMHENDFNKGGQFYEYANKPTRVLEEEFGVLLSFA